MRKRITLGILAALAVVSAGYGQVTPAAGFNPPDDKPSFKVGGTIFADYTSVDSPESKDANGKPYNPTSFNVSRAYINLTGNMSHRISYRITPDIARETGSGSSLSGSQTYRLKYAYGQVNLDDWTNKGSWIRIGVQQTPFVDFEEGIYRYRFQGPIFVDREGFLGSSDAGLTTKWVFPSGYGEVHGGLYNGEGYNKAETNDQKAFMIRGTVRPMPLGGVWKGLRLTGFYDSDAYQSGNKRTRTVGSIAFEHARVNLGATYLDAKDQKSDKDAEIAAVGYSIWATPKLAKGWELLLRHDELKPNKYIDAQKRKRDIFGIACWLPLEKGVPAAVLVDYDSLHQSGFAPARPDDTRYGLKILLNF